MFIDNVEIGKLSLSLGLLKALLQFFIFLLPNRYLIIAMFNFLFSLGFFICDSALKLVNFVIEVLDLSLVLFVFDYECSDLRYAVDEAAFRFS